MPILENLVHTLPLLPQLPIKTLYMVSIAFHFETSMRLANTNTRRSRSLSHCPIFREVLRVRVVAIAPSFAELTVLAYDPGATSRMDTPQIERASQPLDRKMDAD